MNAISEVECIQVMCGYSKTKWWYSNLLLLSKLHVFFTDHESQSPWVSTSWQTDFSECYLCLKSIRFSVWFMHQTHLTVLIRKSLLMVKILISKKIIFKAHQKEDCEPIWAKIRRWAPCRLNDQKFIFCFYSWQKIIDYAK